jgi:hypothetical protein
MLFNINLLGYSCKQSTILDLCGEHFQIFHEKADLMAKVYKTVSKTYVQHHFLYLISSLQWKKGLFNAVDSLGFLSARPIKA